MCQFFFRLSWHFKREKSVFWKASFSVQNKNWLRVQNFVDKTLRLVRISLLISAIQRVLRFVLGKSFYKSNRKLFSCVCIAWSYKHSRNSRILDGYANPRQLPRILPTPLVFGSAYANTENVCYCLNNNYNDINIVSANRMAISCRTKKWNRDIFLSSKVMWAILLKLEKYRKPLKFPIRFAHLRLPNITSPP